MRLSRFESKHSFIPESGLEAWFVFELSYQKPTKNYCKQIEFRLKIIGLTYYISALLKTLCQSLLATLVSLNYFAAGRASCGAQTSIYHFREVSRLKTFVYSVGILPLLFLLIVGVILVCLLGHRAVFSFLILRRKSINGLLFRRYVFFTCTVLWEKIVFCSTFCCLCFVCRPSLKARIVHRVCTYFW